MERNLRKTRVGVVVSDKMDKTIVVAVKDSVQHPLYKKILKRTKKFKAHDENNEAGIGDRVEIMETRKISKDVNWRLVKIIEKAKLRKGLNHREASVLLACEIPEKIQEVYALAEQIKKDFYGNRIVLFAPLYLSNYCVNGCVYCPYHLKNKHIARKKLTQEDIVKEVTALQDMGHKRLALEAGEDPVRNTMDYYLECIRTIYSIHHRNGAIRRVNINIAATTVDHYRLLKEAGIGTYILFQETYHKANYNIYHPRGMKSKFEWRVNGFDRMGQAGVHSIGMGVLIGLEKEWRTDICMMAYHLRYLQKHYWKTKYSVNFPRMRPSENGGFHPNVIMSDRELAQVTFAMRIFDHDVDISYSTREPAFIRDHMATLGVTTMSAESKTEPGGYYSYPQTLEQFHVSDERKAVEVDKALKSLGREPVWKDWDASFDLKRV